jgi:hypothetical protein
MLQALLRERQENLMQLQQMAWCCWVYAASGVSCVCMVVAGNAPVLLKHAAWSTVAAVSLARRFTKLRQFNKSGEYHYVVKESGSEGMTAQWQHMQRQFHLPFPPFLAVLTAVRSCAHGRVTAVVQYSVCSTVFCSTDQKSALRVLSTESRRRHQPASHRAREVLAVIEKVIYKIKKGSPSPSLSHCSTLCL